MPCDHLNVALVFTLHRLGFASRTACRKWTSAALVQAACSTRMIGRRRILVACYEYCLCHCFDSWIKTFKQLDLVSHAPLLASEDRMHAVEFVSSGTDVAFLEYKRHCIVYRKKKNLVFALWLRTWTSAFGQSWHGKWFGRVAKQCLHITPADALCGKGAFRECKQKSVFSGRKAHVKDRFCTDGAPVITEKTIRGSAETAALC